MQKQVRPYQVSEGDEVFIDGMDEFDTVECIKKERFAGIEYIILITPLYRLRLDYDQFVTTR